MTEKHNFFGSRDVVWYILLLGYLAFTIALVSITLYAFDQLGDLIVPGRLHSPAEIGYVRNWALVIEFVFTVAGGALLYLWLGYRRARGSLLTCYDKSRQKILRLNHLYAALSRVNEAIMHIADRTELLNEICRIAVEHGQFKLAWIGLVNEHNSVVEVAASAGDAQAYLDGICVMTDAGQPEGCGPVGLAIRNHEESICNDIAGDPRAAPWRDRAAKFGLRSAAACPLELEGRVVGALTLYSGEVDYFNLTMTRLLFDFSTNISLSLNIFARKARRAQAEKKLLESEGKFRTLVDNLPQMIFVKDVNSVYVACNAVFARSLGLMPEDIVGKTDYDFYPEALANKYRSYDQAVLAGGRSESFEERRITQGREIVVHTAKALFRDEQGVVVGVLGVLTDITGQKQYEEIRSKMELDGRLNLAKEMASGLAHELSQPLAAISNYLVACQRRMAAEGEWDQDKLREAVQLALRQSERAGGIISHIKGLVKSRGHEHGWLNINLLAESTMVFLEDEVSRDAIAVRMDLHPLPQVMACKVEIVQVLLNLYKNAIEEMRACPQRVLTVTTGMNESGEVQVMVSDTGRGVSPDHVDSVFNPFHTSKNDGLGLGLAICRSFIDNHGGRIWVESGAQSGAVFCFTLPLKGRSAG